MSIYDNEGRLTSSTVKQETPRQVIENENENENGKKNSQSSMLLLYIPSPSARVCALSTITIPYPKLVRGSQEKIDATQQIHQNAFGQS